MDNSETNGGFPPIEGTLSILTAIMNVTSLSSDGLEGVFDYVDYNNTLNETESNVTIQPNVSVDLYSKVAFLFLLLLWLLLLFYVYCILSCACCMCMLH